MPKKKKKNDEPISFVGAVGKVIGNGILGLLIGGIFSIGAFALSYVIWFVAGSPANPVTMRVFDMVTTALIWSPVPTIFMGIIWEATYGKIRHIVSIFNLIGVIILIGLSGILVVIALSTFYQRMQTA